MSRTVLEPSVDHPITIEPTRGRVVVEVAGRVVADTTSALTLREARYQPVQYIPMADVEGSLLEDSDHATYCPYKGDASYYSVVTDEARVDDAIWTYREPYAAVAEIAGHVAFYPDKATITVSAD
ncbi:MAG TPA: DUF427 domain-containing protein [Acidimicrobiales bacterium]|nr:DUF427 domain-containing protein [Acidimicrobiales bacterium]